MTNEVCETLLFDKSSHPENKPCHHVPAAELRFDAEGQPTACQSF
jgi:hypothetical protein